jgi:hypothetical protein
VGWLPGLRLEPELLLLRLQLRLLQLLLDLLLLEMLLLLLEGEMMRVLMLLLLMLLPLLLLLLLPLLLLGAPLAEAGLSHQGGSAAQVCGGASVRRRHESGRRRALQLGVLGAGGGSMVAGGIPAVPLLALGRRPV